MEQPTVKLAMLNRGWKRLNHWWKQRKFEKAAAVIRGFGLTPVRLVSIANTTYIEGPDGKYYKVSTEGRNPSPHHPTVGLVTPDKKQGKRHG